jgi:hypothetical protein
MSEEQLHLRGSDASRTAVRGNPSTPSAVKKLAGSQISAQPSGGKSRVLFALVVIVLTVGAGVVWTLVAPQQLEMSIVADANAHVAVAQRAFTTLRSQTQANLMAHCRVLVEDPRLKSTLATEGMDAATVADILQDLSKLRREGFLLVLSPEGRVFAQAGAAELDGVDLSASSVVKKAHDSDDATVGSWVLAGKVMDLSIKSVRYGEALVAYLVVGQPVDEQLLTTVSTQTGIAVASALANKVVLTSKDADVGDAFAQAVGDAASPVGRVITSNGRQYLAAVADLPETAQAHRLVLVASLDATSRRFATFEWMIFVPPGLVLVAVLFALSGIRSPRRSS